MNDNITIALAGNPNSGKTTVFNAMTGSKQHVGNYPGVTVEKKEGKCKFNNKELNIVDLPGTYSLTAYSIEEVVTRKFIIEEKPDILIDVIDSSNIERNLYLTIQLMELETPMILVLNMIDEAKERGYEIDKELLSKLLGCHVTTAVASKGEGVQEILKLSTILIKKNKSRKKNLIKIKYDREIEKQIEELSKFIAKNKLFDNKYPLRWLAIKLLEKDPEIIEEAKKSDSSEQLLELLDKCRVYLKNFFHEEPEVIIADQRYGFVNGCCKETVKLPAEDRITTTEKIDRILTNRILGLPLFILFMWIVFQLTFTLGDPPMKWIEFIINRIGILVGSLMEEGILKSLIVDGVIGGVGGVLAFVPNIMLLFFAIAILEDTGYMARVAFIVDRVMHIIGLHGRSFIPMIIGFGCSVPAIMSTRTLENEKDRLTTIMVLPLMSCGARLPVYTLLIATFFPSQSGGNILFSLYITGIILAAVMAKLFRKFIFTGESSPFVMELPPYRFPTTKSIIIHMWERAWLYLQKAGTTLLALSILMWFLTNFPQHPELNQVDKISSSYAGIVGKAVEPLLKPIGFDWKISIALISGLAAKEVVISTMGTIYNLEESDEHSVGLRDALKKDRTYSPLVAYTLMIFVLIYVPCFGTIVTVWRETNSLLWTSFLIIYTTGLAWIISFIVYQGGKILGFS